MKLAIKYLILIFISTKSYSQENYNKIVDDAGFEVEYVYTKNDTITYLHNKISNKKILKPLIIFIQGSKGIPLLFSDEAGVGSIIPFDYKNYLNNYNFVIISRKGIPLIGKYNRDENGYRDINGSVPIDFKKFDNLEYRTFQLENVLKKIKSKNWVDKNKIFLIGHSEGYRVVAKYSEKDKFVKKFVFMSADPFNRVTEDVVKNRLECFFSNNDTIFQNRIQKTINDAIELKKVKNDKGNDYDLNNWLSYNSDLTYNSLKKIKKPSLIVYGTDDIVSFNNDMMNFLLDNKIFTISALANLDHNFFKQEFDELGKPTKKSYHWDEVFKLIVDWLEKK